MEADSWRSGEGRSSKSRSKLGSRRDKGGTPSDKLGGYSLGHTLGEGEFGKVRIGWKTPDTNSFSLSPSKATKAPTVAIKVISRSRLNTQGRLAKVYREIAILKALDHPNIVRLHEMIDTDSTFGLVLEYASGGELFDYILKHRYLEDRKARKLFAQLISGVGYLHRNGIIHRDLKLENLLLDHGHNIIITDFGFANSFNPDDPLPDGSQYHLQDRDFIESNGLDKVNSDGLRRGDLMSTSCGSPCYAAPELVVSDGLYSGRKVDVWSCGVILYAMLAGYLPFDDDPANPEGDNINLLYKYICTTPLVFPEYVSPHSRDILRRILVPDPTKRADLFEVARHSWLGEFSRTVEAITSGVPLPEEKRKIPKFPHIDDRTDPEVFNSLARSNSLKESTKTHQAPSPLGGPTPKHGHSHIDQLAEAGKGSKTSRDTKRRTVQVEYVPPHTQTTRGASVNEMSLPSNQRSSLETRGIDDFPPVPPEKDYPQRQVSERRTGRNAPRATTDSNAFSENANFQGMRPSTAGSTAGGLRLPPSRGSYGQPSAAAVAPTNAQGRFSRPQPPNNGLMQGDQIPNHHGNDQSAQDSTDYSQTSTENPGNKMHRRGHKRAATLSGLGEKILDRASSVRRPGARRPKPDRTHPPTSMRPMEGEGSPRKSTDSRRSFGFPRKTSDLQSKDKRGSRRFSLLPRSRGEHSQYNGPTQQMQQQPIKSSAGPSPWSDGATGTQGTADTFSQEKWSQLPGKTRRFNDAYDQNEGAGSSGAARRVMEFFRRRK